MFESLSDRLSGVFRSFSGRGQLTEENIQAGLREVRLALLEADVNFKVVKDFVENVRQKCLGQELIKGVSPAQQVVKIVHEELVGLLGGETAGLNLQGQEPAVIMLVGLQGSGKTTSAGKIANLLRKQKMRPYLVPADVYRPAAIDQRTVLAKQLDMPCFPSTVDMNPVDIARQAMEAAREQQRKFAAEEAEKKTLKEKRAEKQAAKATKKKNSTNESGRVGDRPYARGRSYDPEHYGE